MERKAGSIWIWAFWALLALEALTVTVGVGRFSPFLNPLLWFFGSAGAAVAAWFALKDAPETTPTHRRALPAALLIAGLATSAVVIAKLTAASPVDPNVSDIVPTLQIYVDRLLSGKTVYAPIAWESWTVIPNYLPMVWLPYVPADLAGLDYRLFSFLMLGGALLITFRYSDDGTPSWIRPLPVLALLALIISFHTSVFIHSVEFTIAAFYVLLAAGLRRPTGALAIAGIFLCLMSRYSFTFWLPVFFLMLWVQTGFRPMLRTGLIVLVLAVAVSLPFLWNDPEAFTRGMGYYKTVVESLWQPYYWQAAGELPFHLGRGMSFSVWFYEFLPGEATDRLRIAQWMHLTVSGLAAGGIFLYFLKARKQAGFRFGLYALCSLSFYLSVFYAFLYGPFSYLFILPLFVKVPLMWQVPVPGFRSARGIVRSR